jgi:hypothetical protein
MAATDSLKAEPQSEHGARPPAPAEISASEAQAGEEAETELDELIATEIEQPLGPLALALRASVPGPVGRRLVRHGAAVRLRSELRRRAAEVRAGLSRSARDAVDGYRREIHSRLEEEAAR